MVNLLEETLSLINEVYGYGEGNNPVRTVEDSITHVKWAKVYVKFEDRDSILVLPTAHTDDECRKFLHLLEDVKDDNVIYSSGTIFLENSVAWLEKTNKSEVWEHRIVPKFL